MTKKIIFRLKDPGSAITHFIGFLLAATASIPLMIRAVLTKDSILIFSFAAFIFSMMLLYAASTTYHSIDGSERINKLLKKWDHMMISIMIAGSYTPICLIVLKNQNGFRLFILVWSFALLGVLLKAFWVFCPKIISSILYIVMGWLCVLALPEIYHALPSPAFAWLLAGGIFYTIGGIIYALKPASFNQRHPYFGTHEIFHVFVMAGSICHFIVMFCFVSHMQR